MSAPRYVWRQLNPKQREELLAWRKDRGHPWHSPPHRPDFGHWRFLISAACYEHQHYIGKNPERMDSFSCNLLAVFAAHAKQTFAGCVLPNHYHALLEAPDIKRLLRVSCMAARLTPGMVKSRLVVEKFSSAPSNVRCVQTGIIGRR